MHGCHSSWLKNHLQQQWVIASNSPTPEDERERGEEREGGRETDCHIFIHTLNSNTRFSFLFVIIHWKLLCSAVKCSAALALWILELHLDRDFSWHANPEANTAHELQSWEAAVLSEKPKQQTCCVLFCTAGDDTRQVFNIHLGATSLTNTATAAPQWGHALSQQDSGQLMQAELLSQQQLLSNANSQSHLVFVYPCIHYWHRADGAQDHNCVQPLVLWMISGGAVLFSRVALSCHNAVLFSYVLIWAFLLSIFTIAILKYGGVAERNQ